MIAGWIHPITGTPIELDNVDMLGPFLPASIMHSLVIKENADTRHKGPRLTVTAGSGCARKLAIDRMLSVYVDPAKCWSKLRGTWLHEQASYAMSMLRTSDGSPVYLTEEVDPYKCEYRGEIFGKEISCKIDCLKADYSELVDFKFRRPGASNFLTTDLNGNLVAVDSRGPTTDAAQLNMNRMLIEQTIGKSLPELQMIVWLESDGWHRVVVPRLSMDAVGSIKPGSGSYTIKDNFNTINETFGKWSARGGEEATIEERKEIIRELPMAGLEMFKNKKGGNMCVSYCEFKDACFGIGCSA